MLQAALLCTALFSNAPAPDRVAATRAGEYRRILTIPVRIGGRAPVQFFVDTGATTTTISSAFAKQIGIEGAGSVAGRGATGTISARVTTLPSVRIGTRNVGGVRAVVSSDFDTLHGVAPGVVGSLGLNVLKQFTLALDYAHDRVLLSGTRVPPFAGVPLIVGRGPMSTVRSMDAHTGFMPTPAQK